MFDTPPEGKNSTKGTASNFRTILESNRDGIIIINKEGIIQFVNSAAEKLFGRDEQALLNNEFGTPVSCGEKVEIAIHPKGGEAGTAELTTLEILWEDKPAFLLVFHDITEQKKAQQDLKTKYEELEKFNKIAVNRELKMIELKKHIKELEKRLREK